MGICFKVRRFLFLCCLLLAGSFVGTYGRDYDYSANVDCLVEPLAPQYGGGLVGNPDFDMGLDKWTVFGKGKIEARKSQSGNNYLVAYARRDPTDSFAQTFYLKKDLLYTFSAWLQLSEGKDVVFAFVGNSSQSRLVIGSVIARSGCWSMLKGGFTLFEDMKAHLYILCYNTKSEIFMDSVSLEGFSQAEWRQHWNKSIDDVRKRSIKIHVSRNGTSLPGANITLTQTRAQFMIGCGTTASIVSNTAYQEWFVQRFQAVTFDNEMKWYYTQPAPVQENYTIPIAMVSFFEKHGISIRGHNLLWANPNYTQSWVRALPPQRVKEEAERHVRSTVMRYLNDVISWDVVNENLHYAYFESVLGSNASGMFYNMVHSLNAEIPLFLNEFNTLEYPMDAQAIPSRYVERIREIQSFPGNEDIRLGIGLQGHFGLKPELAYVRSVLDFLGATGSPIWISELDTKRGPNQAVELEEIMREVYGHPAVEGIIVWGGWKPTNCDESCLAGNDVRPPGCAQMCLVDYEIKNTPSGDVVDKLLEEWKTSGVAGVTDEDGMVEETVYLGEYSIGYSHPEAPRPGKKIVNVTKGRGVMEVSIDVLDQVITGD